MLDRASVVDEQFLKRVLQGDFPQLRSSMSPDTAELDKKTAIEFLTHKLNLGFLILLRDN